MTHTSAPAPGPRATALTVAFPFAAAADGPATARVYDDEAGAVWITAQSAAALLDGRAVPGPVHALDVAARRISASPLAPAEAEEMARSPDAKAAVAVVPAGAVLEEARRSVPEKAAALAAWLGGPVAREAAEVRRYCAVVLAAYREVDGAARAARSEPDRKRRT